MKTTKLKFATFIAISFLLLSCDKSSMPVVDPPPPPPPGDDLSFRSTVYFYQQHNIINTTRINDAVRTKLKTVGVSRIDKLRSFEIELSHLAFKPDIANMIKIEEGELLIRGSNGDQLFGKYHGYGHTDPESGDLKLMISITGGDGGLSGVSGYISGRCPNYKWDHEVGEMVFTGHLLMESVPI